MEPPAPELAQFPRSVPRAVRETFHAEKGDPRAWSLAVATLGATWYFLGPEELVEAAKALGCGLAANVAWFLLAALLRLWMQPERDLSAARAAQNVYFRGRVTQLQAALEEQTSQTAILYKENLALQPDRNLSKEATALLVEASQDRGGAVMFLPYIGGFHCATNGKDFADPKDPRSRAVWSAAIQELCEHGLLEPRGHKGEVFGVTRRGYEVADQMKSN